MHILRICGDISFLRSSGLVSKEFVNAPPPLADSDALLNQKRPDLIDRCRPSRHQARPDTVQCLKIALILALLRHGLQVRTQRRLSVIAGVQWENDSLDRFPGHLTLARIKWPDNLARIKWLYVDRWNDPRLKTLLAQRRTDKPGTQTASIPTIQRGKFSNVETSNLK
jgi:hypothetical protein